MSDDTEPKTKVRAAGRIAWRLLVPFSAMRSSVRLAKKEFSQTRDNLSVLKELGKQARDTLTEGVSGEGARNECFDDAMRRRSSTALEIPALEAFFLRKKRAALAAGLLFLLVGLYAVGGGLYYGNLRGIALGAASLLATQPIFFVMALDAQFRRWQLRTRRLSREERGGLYDFTREVDGWVWETLKPEFDKE